VTEEAVVVLEVAVEVTSTERSRTCSQRDPIHTAHRPGSQENIRNALSMRLDYVHLHTTRDWAPVCVH